MRAALGSRKRNVSFSFVLFVVYLASYWRDTLKLESKCTNMALRFMYSFSCWSQLISSNTELPSMRVSATYNTPEKMLETTWFCHLHKLKVLKLITHPKHSSFNCLVIIAGKWRIPKRASYKDIEIVVSRDFCHCYCQWAESPSPVDLW